MRHIIPYTMAGGAAILVGVVAVQLGLGPEVYVPLQVVTILQCLEDL